MENRAAPTTANAEEIIEMLDKTKVAGDIIHYFDGVFTVKAGGNTIKLKKDQSGQHHWIPASWVTSVDDKVHVDRPGDQAMKEWMSSPPAGVRS